MFSTTLKLFHLKTRIKNLDRKVAMSKNRKFVRVFQNFYQQFKRKPPSTVKEQSLWLLRSFIVTKKRPDWVNAGFVLPTVAMVSLVVVLLTIAILFRSFERSKNASNVRVNQAVLNAATPAIDRAKAKIDKLFTDPTLPRSTPSDNSLYNAFTKNLSKYTFGDETPLEVKYDINEDGSITNASNTQLENREVSNTAWRFPVDTDNNGKYDSFTLYGVYYRSPTRGTGNRFNRPRNPLDARTPPMQNGSLGGCAGAKGTSASLIGNSGWYKSGANIKKSFFVYAATVPITDNDASTKYGNGYETYKGNKGFSALEYQQDKVRVPIINNAVVYEDDLEITPGSGLKLNGRIFTNSNLLTGRSNSGTGRDIILYQVSSPKSCFYDAENSKIIVGGNVGHGRISGGGTLANGTEVHLYKPSARGGTKYINDSTRTVNTSAGNIAFNSQAYTQRIDQLVEAQIGEDATNDPTEVRVSINSRTTENSGLDAAKVRREELEAYFKKRTRKVPFNEVDFGENPGTASLQGTGDILRAQNGWIYPFDPTANDSSTNYAKLNVELERLEATEPNMLKGNFKEEEQHLGDRIAVGNNLPALWFDTTVNDFVGSKTPQKILPETEWTTAPDNESKRYRNTQIQELISLDGASKRDGFFEIKASEQPQNPLDNVGGMRVVTGAGIYVDGSEYLRADNSFLPDPEWNTNFVDPTNTATNKVRVTDLKFNSQDPIIVWPDSMPMTGKNDAGDTRKGDLVMRATAVYHYTQSSGTDQAPIACVSSYHDPTNEETAQNETGLTEVPDSIGAKAGVSGSSNNGIVYAAPYTDDAGRGSAMTSLDTKLQLQARLVFPNGRFVNEPLRKALLNTGTRSMAENSAIDTAICAIKIKNAGVSRSTSLIPDGAIYEASFLDSREVKAIETAANLVDVTPDYTLDIEKRQPLEVRVTVLDLEKLRTTTISGGLGSSQEYLIPNSGIIYATRDDALEDLSHFSDNIDTRKLLSPTDYKLDSTRRPNGIMLINGKHIHRDLNFRDEEKGLILATNVPAYIKGDLNLHAKNGDESQLVEEFTNQLEANWSDFYDRDGLDTNFACRKNDPRLPLCTLGDSWRPATVVADAVTVLSSNYRFGFRQEGDYDLRNNTGNTPIDNDFGETTVSEVRKKLGFFDNNYLTSALWFTETGTNANKGYLKDFDTRTGDQGSSYVNNFVTPIQRRVKFGEYVMEMCRKVRVETCGPGDWVVQTGKKAIEIPIGTEVDNLDSGTTAKLAKNQEDRHYPRRVAFLRDPVNNKLILDSNGAPVPIGIDSSNKVQYYPYAELKLPFNTTTNKFDLTSSARTFNAFSSSNRPKVQDNALWFQTTGDSSFSNSKSTSKNYGKAKPLFILNDLTIDSTFSPSTGNYKQGGLEQPILVPVLQIHMPADEWTKQNSNANDPGDNRTQLPTTHRNRGIAIEKNWIQRATDTTTNVVIAQGDTPPRKTESNGGLENFVRYLETWRTSQLSTDFSKFNHNLRGSLIQYKRSAYATSPWQMIQENGTTAKNTSVFGFRPYYRIDSTPGNGTQEGEGMSPFYTPPERQWGFDIALLSQIPDLFAQTFTSPTASKPNEFFREVSRDDEWVKTLLCAKTIEIDTSGTISSTGDNAISEDQRPGGNFCPT